jgi:hypothetical protein
MSTGISAMVCVCTKYYILEGWLKEITIFQNEDFHGYQKDLTI